MDDASVDDHSHCETCYRVKCWGKAASLTRCSVIPCPLKCGAKFHACKLEDHKDLCEQEKVKCINFVNGCPLTLQRSKLGSHLERCPASVVYCTMEWNRWPVYSYERQSRVPFTTDNMHAQYGQLDVALALRDQRMLDQAMKAPRSTRRVLRNNLTQRFPAVPINWTESEASQTPNATSAASRDASCNAVFQATRIRMENLTAPSNHNRVRSEDDVLPSHCGSVGTTSELELSLRSSNCDAADPPASPATIGNYNLVENPTSNEQIHMSPIENNHFMPYTVSQSGSGKEEGESSAEVSVLSDLAEAAPVKVACYIPEPPCLMPLKPVKETLSLDLNLESITRYQAKPRSMYTFLCAQEFRRDEYCGHVKHIHEEIHAGLSGWLEQRCPLAHYGCPYSIRQRYPAEKGSEVVYNTVLESFGIRPALPPHQCDEDTPPQSPITQEILSDTKKSTSKSSKSPSKFLLTTENDMECNGNITQDNIFNAKNEGEFEDSCLDPRANFNSLPSEVLRHIAGFLDGYSLCNMALTSRLLREVVCSILEEKGIVTLQWERRMVDGKPSWDVAYKRWIFSTAFSTINRWGFTDHPPMSNHLKTCPFFHRSRPETPHHLPSIKCGRHHSDNFGAVMKRMYPDFTPAATHHHPECNADLGLC